MSTGGVGVGGSEPVGTSAWTRLVIDKYTGMHAELYFGHLCNTQQLSSGPGRKYKGEEGLVNLLRSSVSPMLVVVGAVQTLPPCDVMVKALLS